MQRPDRSAHHAGAMKHRRGGRAGRDQPRSLSRQPL